MNSTSVAQIAQSQFEQIAPWLASHGARLLLIAMLTAACARLINQVIRRAVRLAVTPDNATSVLAERQRENTLIRIFSWTSRIAIYALGLLMGLQEIGIPITPILAGTGIIGLAVGFGGQYLIRDLISGFFIILENQYRIGDVVQIDETGGLVEDISLRMTTLRDLDGTVHHLPHGEIRKVANLSKGFARVNLDIGVGYESNLSHVIETINRVGRELSNDPHWSDKILSTPQFLRIEALEDSAIILKILGDTQPLKQWEVAGELRMRILLSFAEQGINIPYPQRELHIRQSP